MFRATDILLLLGAAAVGAALVFILRWRHQSHAVNLRALAERCGVRSQ